MSWQRTFRLAKELALELEGMGVRKPSLRRANWRLESLDQELRDAGLRRATIRLYMDGYYARAVEEGCKYLNKLVRTQAKAGTGMDGAKLMQHVFSSDKPVLVLNGFVSQSERDEQRGYMQILAGLMTGVRNPRAHDHEWYDSPQSAWELLVLVQHLVDKVKQSRRTVSAPTERAR